MNSAIAHAAEGTPNTFAKSEWTITSTTCPVGCSGYTRHYLQTLQGKTVTLDATHFAAPFADPCEGTVRYDRHHSAAQTIVNEVNRGIAPRRRKLTPKDLGFSAKSSVESAWVLCKNAAGEGNYARVLSMEPQRVQILFEEQSIIELR